MTPYTHVPRQELVDQLLAPRGPNDNDRQSLLAQRLEVARELFLRDLASRIGAGPSMESPDAIREWLKLYYLGQEREIFIALFLDTQLRLICAEELFRGTVDAAHIYPREIVKQALRHNAVAVCIAHNHPVGDAEPSIDDRAVTHAVKTALRTVDLRLVDHFVLSGDEIVSIASKGWL
ncbi:JAB domain-containing protein [Xanthomonas hortorum]|uniref:JAB domain-containing protein n=1 Tax=Xanthomonas hortorum TaxID=56454 RepID=UPI000CEF4F16|nr:JAB domain-containing protein [Xanthomonas hortorum]MCE4369718.1 DNA repair protein RadC [Xanthomonas hortorum pv. hederae]PPU86253.1 hypothetical protein XhhCFBP4925_00550 [Xanthomonas hortorum pv. hederae]PUF01380.1 DNA repair protein RadC [Xanthomonas hortorum pv. hederae]